MAREFTCRMCNGHGWIVVYYVDLNMPSRREPCECVKSAERKQAEAMARSTPNTREGP